MLMDVKEAKWQTRLRERRDGEREEGEIQRNTETKRKK